MSVNFFLILTKGNIHKHGEVDLSKDLCELQRLTVRRQKHRMP